MLWAGFTLAIAVAALAFWRSRQAERTYYESEVYHMDTRAHARYAYAFVLLAAALGAAILWPVVPAIPIVAIFVLIAIFYGATFVRGAAGEDE
ncbi:MAG TPA: hypothetical protein VGR69_07795 [Candidatus Rubrimentiphilum sp.]|nr:hypothetical protein [Candidatus Rubrimentiphilum sp.]